MSVGTGTGQAGTSGMGRAIWRPPAGASSGGAGGARWGLGEVQCGGHCATASPCPSASSNIPSAAPMPGVMSLSSPGHWGVGGSHLNQVRASIPGEGSIHVALQPWPAVSLGPGVPPVPPRVQPEHQPACRMRQPRPCPTALPLPRRQWPTGPFPLPRSPTVQTGPQPSLPQPTPPQSHSPMAQPSPQPVAP